MSSTEQDLEKKLEGSGRLHRSLKLLYVYALATGAILTFMAYWDGMFLSSAGPLTGLGFGIMTILVMPVAFVYCEFAAMLPKVGAEVVYNTVGLNKHFGFLATWLILVAWLAVPPAGMMGIIEWFNFAFNLNLGYSQIVLVSIVMLCIFFWLNFRGIQLAGQIQTVMLFAALFGCVLTGIIFLLSPQWSISNFKPVLQSAMGGGGSTGSGGLYGVIIGVALLITPFFGFETVPQLVEEGTFPIRDMHKAIWGSCLTCGCLYTFYFLCLAGMAPWSVLTEGGSFPPFVSIKMIDNVLHSNLYNVFFGITGVLFTIGTCILGFWVSGVRMLYALGRQNFLPKVFAKTNKYGQPIVPNLLILGVSLVALIVMNATSFLEEFFCLMSFCCASAYAITSAASIRAAIIHPNWERPYKIPGGMPMRVIALVVSSVTAWLCTLGQPGWTQWFLYMGLGAILWLWMVFVKWPKEAVWMETPEGVKEY
jgi:APA family basic amino acid/polyamine antiporter